MKVHYLFKGSMEVWDEAQVYKVGMKLKLLNLKPVTPEKLKPRTIHVVEIG